MVTISITTPCLKDFPGLHHMRIPVCNSASPTEADFDILVQTLVGTTINCPVIISDQVTESQVCLLERSVIIQSKWANFRLWLSYLLAKELSINFQSTFNQLSIICSQVGLSRANIKTNIKITFHYLLTGGTLKSKYKNKYKKINKYKNNFQLFAHRWDSRERPLVVSQLASSRSSRSPPPLRFVNLSICC